LGQELVPTLCEEFAWDIDTGLVTSIVISEQANAHPIYSLQDEVLHNRVDLSSLKVVMPSFTNGHTHIGDCCLPDGATGMTLEEAFFRPAGYKYRMLEQISSSVQVEAMRENLQYMAATGTTRHLDFREQGLRGLQLLREAAKDVGLESIILSQLHESPFPEATLDNTDNPHELPPEAVQELEELFTAGADGFSESTMNDLTESAWSQIRQMSYSNNKARAIHCLESSSNRDVSVKRYGRGDLERALTVYDPHLVVHMTTANDDEIQLAVNHFQKNRNPCFVLCPRANSILGLPQPPIAKLITAGLPLLLGTDNVMLNAPNMFAEMDYAYKLCKSQFGDAVRPDPKVILQMATVNASLLPFVDECHLQLGLRASFVVLDFGSATHLRRSCNIIASIVSRAGPADIEMTVHRGRCLYQRP
jgi:cytosine/adenosine deaminase-related metal-dependent hydrolase